MNQIFEILKYTLPSIIVLFTAYFLIKTFLENENKKKMLEMKMNNQSNNQRFITPIRLQAYERIVLFLERISPNSLLLRVSEPNMNVAQLQTAMIVAIREEYEHNLSQQLYISAQAWQIVKNAKDDLINVINNASGNLDKNANSAELAKVIFELIASVEKLPVEVAIELVKNEIYQEF